MNIFNIKDILLLICENLTIPDIGSLLCTDKNIYNQTSNIWNYIIRKKYNFLPDKLLDSLKNIHYQNIIILKMFHMTKCDKYSYHNIYLYFKHTSGNLIHIIKILNPLNVNIKNIPYINFLFYYYSTYKDYFYFDIKENNCMLNHIFKELYPHKNHNLYLLINRHDLYEKNQLHCDSNLRVINVPESKKSRETSIRKVHASSFGYFSPIETRNE